MKYYCSSKVVLGTLIVGCLTFLSCSKNEIDINFPGSGDNQSGSGSGSDSGSGGTDNTPSTTKKTIYFEANVLSMLTKASTGSDNDPISAGRNVMIQAYSNNAWISTNYYLSGSGVLNPVTGSSEMTLPTGKYSFYAAGVNTPSITVPTFSGLSGGSLQNQADYIWSTKANYTPMQISNTVSLNFTHSCTQVLVCLKPTSDVSVSNVSMTLTAPVTNGCTWDLITGAITPATSFSTTATALNTSQTSGNFWCQMIMMPVAQSAGNPISTFSVTLNQESTPRNYTLILPMQEGGLEAGKAYVYYTTLTADTVKFSDVTVAKWQYVNVNDGTPMIPRQDLNN